LPMTPSCGAGSVRSREYGLASAPGRRLSTHCSDATRSSSGFAHSPVLLECATTADESCGRSFSTHPRQRRHLTTAQLELLQACEQEMAEKLVQILDRHARVAALVSRIGTDLSSLRFEGETPHFTHVALALREGAEWWIHHLLNTHEGPHGHLYRQRPL